MFPIRRTFSKRKDKVFVQFSFKTLWTLLVIVIDQCSQKMFLNMCIKYQQTCENLNSIGRRSCEITRKEKTPLSCKIVCFQMLDFETSNSKPENSWKITSFSKTTFTSEGAVSHDVLYYQPLPLNLLQSKVLG